MLDFHRVARVLRIRGRWEGVEGICNKPPQRTGVEKRERKGERKDEEEERTGERGRGEVEEVARRTRSG